MKFLEELILKNQGDHPKLLEYKNVIVKFIESHKQQRPDMCVEGCKALIEGISKLVYFDLGADNKNTKKWNNFNFAKKFNETIEILQLEDHEKEFTKRNSQLVHKLGEIRNARGDISHGQAYPKNSYATPDFAIFVSLWTEALCCFLLLKYISISEKKYEKSPDIYSLEQFEEFNNYLDSIYPEVKFIVYSKALKEQDAFQYEVLMDDYYSNQ